MPKNGRKQNGQPTKYDEAVLWNPGGFQKEKVKEKRSVFLTTFHFQDIIRKSIKMGVICQYILE